MNLERICRLCLEEVKPLLNVHDSVIGIPGKIGALSSVIEIKEGDGLPEQVCQDCVDQLEMCHKFIQKCKDSDYTLRQYLQKQEEDCNKIPLGDVTVEDKDWQVSGVLQTDFSVPDTSDPVKERTETKNEYAILRNLLAAKNVTTLEEGNDDNKGVLHRLLATAASNGVEIKAVEKSPRHNPDDDMNSWKLFGSELDTFYSSTAKMKLALPSSSNQEMIDLAMLPFTRYSNLLEQHCKSLRRPSAHQKPHSNRAVIVDCYNCALRCHEKLGAQERAQIHKQFHELEDYAAQRLYITSRVERFEPRRRKTNKPSRRKISQIFTLEYGGVIHRVCKKFFLSTLDISDKKARIFLKKKTVQKTASLVLLNRGIAPVDASYFICHNANTND